MPNSNKLSIYMIKDEFAHDDDLILDDHRDILAEIPNVGIAYYKPSYSSPPQWLPSFFGNIVKGDKLFSANARVVLIIRINVTEKKQKVMKAFAVTMGYGKYLFKENVTEERFGLQVVLNTIKPNNLRRINKTSIGGNQKVSNEQLPLKSDISEFGFDIDRDLIGDISGISDDEEYAKGIITGGDMLSLTADVDISNIMDFIKKTYKKYKLTSYRTNFPWIDHIKKVKDDRILNALNDELIRHIQNDSQNVWMAVPEIIKWEDIAGFKYNGKDILNDIDISIVRDSFRKGLTDVDQLKSKRITAISALDNESTYTSWQMYNCLFGEIELDGKAYCINNGKWYCVDNEFVAQINREYLKADISTVNFIDFSENHKNENAYSEEFAKTDPEQYICMDARNIPYGGGRSKIELCDILTTGKTFIHIKPYSGSSTLSHLFNQAVVSAELVLADQEFYNKANDTIRNETKEQKFQLIRDTKMTIVFVIISRATGDRPPMPFFSRVAFKYIKRRLEVFGYAVYIKNIKNIKPIKQKSS